VNSLGTGIAAGGSSRAVGLAGAGAWGRNHARVLRELGALGAVAEMDPARRAELTAAWPDLTITASFDELLGDDRLGAVVIATPASSHGTLVRQALEAGKDVLVEKPLCLSASEGAELVRLAQQRERVLMVGHLLWYHPAVLRLRDLIRNGELGRIRYIYSSRLNLGRIRREENSLWSFAPHDISLILGLVGEMPDDVEARGGNYLHNGVADVTVSLLGFPSGIRAHVFVSWLHPFKEQKLVVVGERQMALFDDLDPTNPLLLYPHSIEWRDHAPIVHRADGVPVPIEAAEPLKLECLHFLECVATRAHPRTDGEEGLRVLRVLEQLQRRLEAAHHPAAASHTAAAAPATAARPDGLRTCGDYQHHESAYVDDGAEVGAGTVIWHFSHVLSGTRIGPDCRIGQNVVLGPNVSIGRGVKIQNNVSVYHGVTLEDEVFCGPSMVFTNVINPRSAIRRMDEIRPTLVRRGATLGANCTIVCGVTIGRYAFVGAGAVVTRDVPDHALVVGNPARVRGWMCTCGNAIDFPTDGTTGACPTCKQAYHRHTDGHGTVVAPLSSAAIPIPGGRGAGGAVG
jgi:UDP-2-acetamido-3-amino-2,3-dideoxy-glucuronate N-acetyltransferase